MTMRVSEHAEWGPCLYVGPARADDVRSWLVRRGVRFHEPPDLDCGCAGQEVVVLILPRDVDRDHVHALLDELAASE